MAPIQVERNEWRDARAVSHFSSNTQMWDNLKQAIAASSGFKRWQLERLPKEAYPELNLDCLVSGYLRETLETLAY